MLKDAAAPADGFNGENRQLAFARSGLGHVAETAPPPTGRVRYDGETARVGPRIAPNVPRVKSGIVPINPGGASEKNRYPHRETGYPPLTRSMRSLQAWITLPRFLIGELRGVGLPVPLEHVQTRRACA